MSKKVSITGWSKDKGPAYSITESVPNAMTFGMDTKVLSSSSHKTGKYDGYASAREHGYLFLNKGHLYTLTIDGKESVVSAEDDYVALHVASKKVNVVDQDSITGDSNADDTKSEATKDEPTIAADDSE